MKSLNPRTIPKILLRIIQSMQQNPDPYVMNPGKDFSRHRSLSFQDVALAIITMGSHKVKKELYFFFAPLKRHIPANSAFSQQRAKFNAAAFPHILSAFNKACPFKKKLKGLHPIALDGSDVNVPSDIRDCASFIPYNSRNGGYHQLHINAAFHLLEQRFTDIVIQPRGVFNETAAACDIVDRNPLNGKCLFFCDRGYECFNLMAHISDRNHFFLIRAKDASSVVSPYHSLELPESGDVDKDITIIFSRSRKNMPKEGHDLFKVIPKNTRFDYIAPDDRDSTCKLSFRLIRISLENGKDENLLTNLPRKMFALSEMKDLYHLRWQIMRISA